MSLKCIINNIIINYFAYYKMVHKKKVSRKSPRRKSPRRKSPRRKSPRRKSPRRKSRRRKSPRRKSPRRKSMNSSPENKVYKPVKKSTQLTTPLKIYTSPGCPACTSVKELCKKKGLKFTCYNRRYHSEYVKRKTGNCRYVPNVFNSKGQYIGGNEDMIELTKDIKDIGS